MLKISSSAAHSLAVKNSGDVLTYSNCNRIEYFCSIQRSILFEKLYFSHKRKMHKPILLRNIKCDEEPSRNVR